MKMNYTEAAKERCFSLIDTEIDSIWDDIDSMPEDTDSERWKKKLTAIAAEYTLSSRFALMRIFQGQAVDAREIERDNSTGFEIKFSDGSVGVFKDISIEHAAIMEQDELDLYEKLMMDRAARQSGADYKSDLKLVQKALQNHQKKTTLLTKEEAMSLGHIIGLTLKEMEWFLLRVFNVDGGFRFNSSEDLIDAYVFLRAENLKTGSSAAELKAIYNSKYGSLSKSPHDENMDWTQDNSCSLSENVRNWSSDDCDERFMEWMGERAEHLDLPSATALRIYRKLAVYIYNLIKDDIEEGTSKAELNYSVHDYPNVDYVTYKDSSGIYHTDFVLAVRKAREEQDISVLFENGKVSQKQCDLVAHRLLKKNQALAAVTPHPDWTKNWRDLFISEKGKLSPNGGINATRSRVSNILFGTEFIQKNDMLYLLWFITCLCWGYGSEDPDIKTRLDDFIDVCINTLNDAGLPDFYPPHIMEQIMMLCAVYAYSCEKWEKAEPLIIYNEICESLIERRAKHTNRKKSDNK